MPEISDLTNALQKSGLDADCPKCGKSSALSNWLLFDGLKQNPKHGEFPERIWEIIENKVIDIAEEITNSEDDRAAIAKFKKPYFQLSDAEKETLEEDLDDRYTLDAIAYCLICKALDLWTPKFWRLDDVAAKIAEVEKAEYEKEKAVAEKRVPLGN